MPGALQQEIGKRELRLNAPLRLKQMCQSQSWKCLTLPQVITPHLASLPTSRLHLGHFMLAKYQTWSIWLRLTGQPQRNHSVLNERIHCSDFSQALSTRLPVATSCNIVKQQKHHAPEKSSVKSQQIQLRTFNPRNVCRRNLQETPTMGG